MHRLSFCDLEVSDLDAETFFLQPRHRPAALRWKRFTSKAKDSARKQVYRQRRAGMQRFGADSARVGVVNIWSRRGALEAGSELFGKAFENWVFHELSAYVHYTESDIELAYRRLASGIEVDFVLPDVNVTIEVKSTDRVREDHCEGLRALAIDQRWARRCYVVCREPRVRKTADEIMVLPYNFFLWNSFGPGSCSQVDSPRRVARCVSSKFSFRAHAIPLQPAHGAVLLATPRASQATRSARHEHARVAPRPKPSPAFRGGCHTAGGRLTDITSVGPTSAPRAGRRHLTVSSIPWMFMRQAYGLGRPFTCTGHARDRPEQRGRWSCLDKLPSLAPLYV